MDIQEAAVVYSLLIAAKLISDCNYLKSLTLEYICPSSKSEQFKTEFETVQSDFETLDEI